MTPLDRVKKRAEKGGCHGIGAGLRVSADTDQAARRHVGEAARAVLPLAAKRKMIDKVEAQAISKKAP